VASPTVLAPKAILFDFDGTLADTAPDLAFSANVLRTRRGLDALPLNLYRPHVSRGGRGMVWVAFGKTPDDDEFGALKDEFLDVYAENLCVHSRFFEGIDTLLDTLIANNIAWGIVTNKATRFTTPIVEAMGLRVRTECIVSGDTTAHAKPHPAPLLHAAQLLGHAPQYCWYIGDDERDIVAAKAAGMCSVAAAYGYLGGSDPRHWEADHLIEEPLALLRLLGLDRTALT
jgi:N-acetyl-D-muramate 6-phosphate phosphatase